MLAQPLVSFITQFLSENDAKVRKHCGDNVSIHVDCIGLDSIRTTHTHTSFSLIVFLRMDYDPITAMNTVPIPFKLEKATLVFRFLNLFQTNCRIEKRFLLWRVCA